MTQPPPDKAPSEQRFREFEDPHYHDDGDVALPADEDEATKRATARKLARKLITKRRYPNED